MGGGKRKTKKGLKREKYTRECIYWLKTPLIRLGGREQTLEQESETTTLINMPFL